MLINQEILQNQLLLNKEFLSKSLNETELIGEKISSEIKDFLPGIIFLNGDLGSGKTYLTKGIAQGFEIDKNLVVSPTFILVREHHNHFIDLYHCDLYRIYENLKEMEYLDIFENITPKSLFIIEWPPDKKLIKDSQLSDEINFFINIEIEILDETTRRLKIERII